MQPEIGVMSVKPGLSNLPIAAYHTDTKLKASTLAFKATAQPAEGTNKCYVTMHKQITSYSSRECAASFMTQRKFWRKVLISRDSGM
ncbi:uncharacterized protein EMH_0096120 [Eimeria mitis]|uniref:Uncharacterized protein n=1 Tax=Eimeria mitis TaxID=44415 RepID=U6KHX9_9EIME|nr:uncharacterized protein EMH_0096120 [Eimeria mitis]CDJ35837.1 hypothetical protein EMH_0096120 [Eimeria mitis]